MFYTPYGGAVNCAKAVGLLYLLQWICAYNPRVGPECGGLTMYTHLTHVLDPIMEI